MKFAYRNRELWCIGYYVDTAGKNTAAIKEYIAKQLEEDRKIDQLSIPDPRDPSRVASNECVTDRSFSYTLVCSL